MERCLYTYCALNKNSPPDEHTASREHIVPYAIGGSDLLAIDYCSKKANNDFGRDIDAPFIELPLIGFKRHLLGIKGYSGIVPDIVFQGKCTEINRECKIVFPFGGDVYPDFGIDVAGSLDSGRMSFSGSEERLRGAVTSMLQKASRKSLTALNDNLKPIYDFDDAMTFAEVESGKTLHFQISFGYNAFFVPWARGILKMALGLGARTLGRTWAFSPTADNLRMSLICDSAELANQPIRGAVMGKLPQTVKTLLGVRGGRHTLAVLPNDRGMVAYISLFGGEVFDAIIDLGSGPADVNVANDEAPANWECAFHIDPVTRQLEIETLDKINARTGSEAT